MKIRNLLTAGAAFCAIALPSVVATPAAAQVGGSITIGIGDPRLQDWNTYDRDRDGFDDRYEDDRGTRYDYGYSYNGYSTPYGAFGTPLLGQTANRCGYNRVELRMNNLHTNRGTIVLARDRGNRGFYRGEVLRGDRFYASSRVCVDARDVQMNRVALIHDINNNGRFDRRDGIGYIAYGANYGYGRSVINVHFRY